MKLSILIKVSCPKYFLKCLISFKLFNFLMCMVKIIVELLIWCPTRSYSYNFTNPFVKIL